jgi:glycolate dehydrogenase FAD-linked subunit
MMDSIAYRGASRAVIGTFGHAGDGNLHPTILFQNSYAASRTRALAAVDEIVRAAMELGGTISAEHGVASLKRDYLAAMVGEAQQALMRRIRRASTPTGS